MESSRNKPRTLAIILGAAITDLQNHGKAKSGEASERAFNAAIDTINAVAEELKEISGARARSGEGRAGAVDTGNQAEGPAEAPSAVARDSDDVEGAEPS